MDDLQFYDEPPAPSRIHWRGQYDDEADANERKKTDVEPRGIDPTQQHHKDEVDLNVMVKRFGIGDGAIPPAALDPAHFGDFTDATDFKDALDKTREAVEHFNALPAAIRDEFQNDPVRLMEFVHDPKNADKAVEMGLLHRAAKPTQQEEKTPPKE